MYLEVILKHNETDLMIYHAPEIAYGKSHEGLLLYPNPDNTGYEFTERMLKEKRLSRSLTDEACPRRRRVLRFLCHLESANDKDSGNQGTLPLERALILIFSRLRS